MPRTATQAPFTWSGSALVKLTRVGHVSVQPPKMPDRVASAGMQGQPVAWKSYAADHAAC